MKRARKRSAASTITGSQFRAVAARHNANRHLRAYVMDRNPQHVLDAWAEYRRAGVMPPEAMMRNLDHALAEIRKRPGVRPRTESLRDAELYHLVHVLRRAWPEVPIGEIQRIVARDHGVKVGNLRKIISNMETALADPSSDRAPRAFRK